MRNVNQTFGTIDCNYIAGRIYCPSCGLWCEFYNREDDEKFYIFSQKHLEK